MPSSLSTTLHSFFGGSGSDEQGDSLGGFLRKVLPIPVAKKKVRRTSSLRGCSLGYISEERLFVNRETLGFMLEVDTAVRRRRAHGRDPRVPVRDLPAGCRHPVDVVRLASCARLLVAIRQLARGRRRPRRKSQALRAPGAQHQPLPHPCPQAVSPTFCKVHTAHSPRATTTRCATSSSSKRLRRGQHRQHDNARKPAAATRKHLDHAARGLLSEPGLYRGRPHQLVCAVLQPASH